MKLFSILLAALVALAIGGALAGAQAPKNDDVTLDASANPTLFRTPTTLSGRVKGEKEGVSVVLQRRSSLTDTTFSDVATAVTTGNGEYTFTVRPRRNGYFRAVARTTPEKTSDELFLQVAPKVSLGARSTTVAAGAKARFRGKVRPRHNGRKVQIQRRNDAGAFETVATARLRKATRRYSRFRKRVAVPATGVYRAVLPGHADHAEGVSPELTITTS